MNERMRELYDQADKFACQNRVQSIGAPGNNYFELFHEKFAELILRECGNWFNDRLVVEPDYGIEHRVERNRAVTGVMKEFNRHFGVEE